MTGRRTFDLLIFGSGSAAFASAIKASDLGARVAMTEHDTLGGTCVNRGCIPSKNLIEAARIVHEASHPRYPGLAAAHVDVDFGSLIRQKQELVEELRYKKYQSIVDGDVNIEVIAGKARFAGPLTAIVGDATVTAEKFLIATGSRPSVPAIPGLEQTSYLTSRELFELEEIPPSLVILGGGYVALELGQMMARLGSKVTLLVRSDRLLPGWEPDLIPPLVAALEADGVEILLETAVSSVEPASGGSVIHITGPSGRRDLRASKLLVATGHSANSEGLGLDTAGVEMNADGFIRVDSHYRTTAQNVWAVGDVTGPPLATPVAAREAVLAAENALNDGRKTLNYDAIPRAIFTDPEIASVGLTERQAEERGIDCRCQSVEMALVPKAVAIHKTRGVINMVIERATNRIIGVHLIADRGADLIHEAALAVRLGLTTRDIIETIHVYPTMAEAIRMVAQAFEKDVSRLSCCAE